MLDQLDNYKLVYKATARDSIRSRLASFINFLDKHRIDPLTIYYKRISLDFLRKFELVPEALVEKLWDKVCMLY